MRTVTLGLASRKKVNERVGRAFEGKYQGDFISFASPETLFNVLAGRRWELLEIMTGQGPIAIREAARRQGRDVKAVHSDVQRLLKAGLLYKTDDGRIEFPYDEIHVNFMLEAA